MVEYRQETEWKMGPGGWGEKVLWP